MAGDDSYVSGHIHDGDQDVGVLRAEVRNRRAALRAVEQKFDRLTRCVEELTGQTRSLAADVNRNSNGDRLRPREGVARGQPINRPVPAYNYQHQIYDDDSDDEDIFANKYRQQIYDDSDEDDVMPNYGRFARYGSNDRNTHDHDRGNNDFKLKIDIPYFNGFFDIEEFIDWLVEVERIFDYMEVPEEKKVKLVAYKLTSYASAWWERLQHRRSRERRAPVRSWHRMKQLLKGEFLPPDYEYILFQRYQRCHQGKKSVYEYTTEFMRLARRNDLRESERQKVARYLKGLNQQIRDMMGVQVLRNLYEAKNVALKMESIMQDGGIYDSLRRNYNDDNYKAPIDKSKQVQQKHDSEAYTTQTSASLVMSKAKMERDNPQIQFPSHNDDVDFTPTSADEPSLEPPQPSEIPDHSGGDVISKPINSIEEEAVSEHVGVVGILNSTSIYVGVSEKMVELTEDARTCDRAGKNIILGGNTGSRGGGIDRIHRQASTSPTNVFQASATMISIDVQQEVMAKQWQVIQVEVKQKIEQANVKYKEAIDKHQRTQVFEMVIVPLRKERFPVAWEFPRHSMLLIYTIFTHQMSYYIQIFQITRGRVFFKWRGLT